MTFANDKNSSNRFNRAYCFYCIKMGDNEIARHFIHVIKTKGYDVNDVNVIRRKK